MSSALPQDIQQLIADEMLRGRYGSEHDVLRAALKALADQDADLAAIAAGIDDMESGCMVPAVDAEALLRRKLGFDARS